jgi:hypothetical protein
MEGNPMSVSPRKRACAANLRLETLEGRALLSRGDHAAPVTVLVHLSQEYVSQQTAEVDVTLTRSSRAKAESSQPLQVQIVTTASEFPPPPGTTPSIPLPGEGTVLAGESQAALRAARAAVQSALVVPAPGQDASKLPVVPIDGAYTFLPGQTTLTIPLHLNPGFPNTGQVGLQISAVPPSPRAALLNPMTTATLFIESNPDKVPPTIVASSHTPSAITLTFSKPMDPTNVQNVNNYLVTGNPSEKSFFRFFLEHPGRFPRLPLITLKSAVYDPATQTVTLTPTSPLTLRSYQVSSPDPSLPTTPRQPPAGPSQVLTDVHGNPIADQGSPGSFGATA